MQTRKRTPISHGRLLLILIPAVFAVLFLAACDSSSPQGALPATALSEIVPLTEVTVTNLPVDTSTPTASPTLIATETLTPQPSETPAPQIYVVQEGDSLWLIAEEFKTTMNTIQLANELYDANAIYVGQELIIPPPTASLEAQPPPPAVTAEGMAGTTVSSAATETMDGAATLPADRAVLYNHILCPAEEDIDPEGGAIIGRSAVCRIPIVSYQLGEGATPLILVGGMHGGYEWNTILLAYRILDHLRQNPELIPPSLTIHLIPNANPDGLYAVTRRTGRFSAADVAENTEMGRFNGHYVDLNRNWDCDWTPNAMWRDSPISGGSAPFSEPENQALRDFILGKDPAAALFLHSAATGVYISGCGQPDPASTTLGKVYSNASGYPLYDGFHYYDVTGDAGDWLATQGIPSITVELSTHEALDWNMNLLGLSALIDHITAATEEIAQTFQQRSD